jgi:hypothetical protein
MIILSIDVGYTNLGLSRALIDENFNVTFTYVHKVDLGHVVHGRVPAHECTIPHTRETCDRIDHFVQEYWPLLEECDFLLIERQPPTGLKDVEGLLMSKFRKKTILISPNSMHKYFRISHLDYEQRKDFTTDTANKYVGHFANYKNLIRKHDIADSVCMCLYHTEKLRQVDEKKKRFENLERLPFDEYRFVKK